MVPGVRGLVSAWRAWRAGLRAGHVPSVPDGTTRRGLSMLAVVPAVVLLALSTVFTVAALVIVAMLTVPVAFVVHGLGLRTIRAGAGPERVRPASRALWVVMLLGVAAALTMASVGLPDLLGGAVLWDRPTWDAASATLMKTLWSLLFLALPPVFAGATAYVAWPYASRLERGLLSAAVAVTLVPLALFGALGLFGLVLNVLHVAGGVFIEIYGMSRVLFVLVFAVVSVLHLAALGLLRWRTRPVGPGAPSPAAA